MTFPVVQTTNTSHVDTAGTSHAVSMPASVASGDLLWIMFAAGASVTTSTPSGWTSLNDVTNGTLRLTIFYKVSDGTEGATVTVTTSANTKSAHNTYRITGHDVPNTAPEVGTASTGNGTGPNPPSLNPAGWGAEDTLWLAVEGNVSNGSNAASGWPASYSGGISVTSTSGTGASAVGSARRQLNAASEDPGIFTITIADYIAQTIAVRTKQVTVYTQSLTASLSFSGTLSKKTARSFTASLAFSGALGAGRIFFQALSSTLSFSGTLTKRTGKSLTGAISFVGSLVPLGLIADVKGLAAAISSLIHQALSSNAPANSAAASDAEPGDATGGSS